MSAAQATIRSNPEVRLNFDLLSRHCWNYCPACHACLLLETKWDRFWSRVRKSHRRAHRHSKERISHAANPWRFRFAPRTPGVSREIEAWVGSSECGTGSHTGQRHRTDGGALWQTGDGRQGKAPCGKACLRVRTDPIGIDKSMLSTGGLSLTQAPVPGELPDLLAGFLRHLSCHRLGSRLRGCLCMACAVIPSANVRAETPPSAPAPPPARVPAPVAARGTTRHWRGGARSIA